MKKNCLCFRKKKQNGKSGGMNGLELRTVLEKKEESSEGDEYS